jgi:hypothetical protein
MAAQGFFEKHRDKIEVGGPGECWPWTAAAMDSGYGQVQTRGKTRLAHREAFDAVNGFGSSDGFVIRHKCDNPPCVNPDHLERGTQGDNVRDRDQRGRQSRGEARPLAKLTESDVRAIRADYVRGSRTHGLRSLARRFGVDHTVIGDVVNRQVWKHV